MPGSVYQKLVDELHQAQKKEDKQKERDLLFRIGILYYEKADHNRSNAIFKDLLREDKKLKEANYYLALNALAENKTDQATSYLEKELKVNPKSKHTKDLKEKLIIHSNIPLVTITLLILNIAVFLFIFPEISYSELIKFTAHHSSLSFFQLFSSLFFHSSLGHFGLNMIILLFFGLYLEKHIGSIRFLGIYVISGLVGNAVQAVANIDAFVLGASTAIFGMLGAVVMREPLLDVKVFGLFRMPIIVLFGAFFVIENMFQYTVLADQLYFGNLAHIIGFLTGVLITGTLYQDTIDIFYNWLAISFGFLIFSYGLGILYTTPFLTLQDVSLFVLLLIIASLIIWYSYEKLKLMNIIYKENEFGY